jgi:hypothetical protein
MPDLSHHDQIQRSFKTSGDLRRYDNPAARQSIHNDRQAFISLQSLCEPFARIPSIAKHISSPRRNTLHVDYQILC